PPWFFVVSFTVIVDPATDAENDDTRRSGPGTVIDLDLVLLVSFNSVTVVDDGGQQSCPSATTIRYQVTVGVASGIVTVVKNVLLPPAARTPTGRPARN